MSTACRTPKASYIIMAAKKILMAKTPESNPYTMPRVDARAQTRAEWALGIPPVLTI
jgi:hypothetical protein